MPSSPRPLNIKVTCAADAPERSNQGLTVAATAVSAGARVSLWLTGEAAWLGTDVATDGRPPAYDLEHAVAPGDLVSVVLEGGRVTVCSQCAARRGIGDDDLLARVRLAGAALWTEEVLAEGVQALVY
ncbi:DsrE family protein [Nocardioides sp. AX2bis]|uniref:DsrE family protein n=1 Tax=Nocardioides sp. AX2bis TaxID=2653157 RepID=UPI0012EF0205|nr:DsrE family protein [Nocardioides sp. AX2bis]VXC49333.1 Peroxiredoxin [Nocardioides sp. AX2bis]